MNFAGKKNSGVAAATLFLVLSISMPGAKSVFAQEPMIGAQNGVTWRGLVIGTEAETITRKTFYVDGMYNLSVYWSQHAELKTDAVNYNDAFIGVNVGQIRDGLDSFYVDDKNLQIPIIDAVLVVRLQNAQIGRAKVDEVIRELREATINGIDPTRENKIWRTSLRLLR